MKKSALLASLATLALGVGLLAGSALAGGGASNDPVDSSKSALRAGTSAPNARIAAFIQAGGTNVRSKGLAGVTHPSTGVYCLDPAADAFNVNRAIPQMSVDWSTSLGDALMAHWRSAGVGCPAGQFAVLTFDGEDGTFDLSDSVSFTFYVP